MPSSDGKKLSNLKKNLGVSIKRKRSTSPSALQQSSTTKKKIPRADQQNFSAIKSSLRSYDLRSSHLSKSTFSNEEQFHKSKDEKQLCSSVKKASNRCSFCSHFIPADNSSCICFSCHFKYSEPRAYKSSRRSISLRSTNKSSDDPEVIAIVSNSKQKEILVVHGRNRRKHTSRLKDSSQSENGGVQTEVSKPVSDVAKQVNVKMASESNGNGKKKPIELRYSKKAKYLDVTKTIAETLDESVSNSKAAEPISLVVTRSKRLSVVLKESLFPLTEAISKKRRSTDSLDNYAKKHSSDNPAEMPSFKEAGTKDQQKTGKSSSVKSKRKTYECDRCEKLFTHRQRFRIHRRKCKPRLTTSIVSVDEDSESTLSNYLGVEFGVDAENPVLDSSDKVEKSFNISSCLDNAPSESTVLADGLIRNVDFSGEISSECPDPLSSQGKVDEATTNEESFSLPDTECSLDTSEMFSEETKSCFNVLETFLDSKTSSLDPKKTCSEINEQCSNSKDLCLNPPDLHLDATESSLDITEHSLDVTEPSLDATEPSLDATEPSLDATEPSLDATEPSLDNTEHTLHTNEPSSDATEHTLDATEPSLDATEPFLDVIEPSLDNTEPSLDATEPSLDATEPFIDSIEPSLDATNPTLDATEPTLDADELLLDAIDTSLNNTQPSLNVPEPSFDTTEHCLDAIELSLDATESCMYLEESFLNPEVSSLGATVQISDTKDNNVIQHCLEIIESSLDAAEDTLNSTGLSLNGTGPSLIAIEPNLNTTKPFLGATYPSSNAIRLSLDAIVPSVDATESSLDATQPSLDATASCIDTTAHSFKGNENYIDAVESCMVEAKSDLKTARLHTDASKTEFTVNGEKNSQLNLEDLGTSLQLRNCCLEKGWETYYFKEKEPNLERLAPSLKVPEFSMQSFLKGKDSCLMEIECNSKNVESSVEECSSTLHDPKIGLAELNESLNTTQFGLPGQKASVEVGLVAEEPVSNEKKSTLKEVDGSLEINSNLSQKQLFSKDSQLNLKQDSLSLKGQDSSLNGEESTLKQKEYSVGNHLQSRESHEEVAKTSLESQNQIEEIDISQEEVEIIFCPQITSVFSVSELSDESKVEPEAKEDISSYNVLKPFTNAGPRNLSTAKDELKADNSNFARKSSSRMVGRNSFMSEKLSRPVPPKWENCGLRKGKRKPEDSVRGKEPVKSHLPSSNNKSLDGKGMSGACRLCGNPLSFPAPTDNSTKARVVDRNICFSSATTCQYCSAKQNIQFSLATRTINDMFSYHLSNFINRNERMTHRNLKGVPVNLLASANYAQVDASNASGSQTFNSTDLVSMDNGNLDSLQNFPCTPPSSLGMPPSPFSCSSSIECHVAPAEGQMAPEEGQVAPEEVEVSEEEPAREITLTEHMFKEFDVYNRGTEDSFLCMRFKSEACLQPLRRRDIAMHYFTTHDSPSDRSIFNMLHVDD